MFLSAKISEKILPANNIKKLGNTILVKLKLWELDSI